MSALFQLPVKYEELTSKTRWRVRAQYVRDQHGLCCHCKGDLTKDPIGKDAALAVNHSLFPPGFFTHPVHLHHNHKTGWTIGAIHPHCNAVLFQYYGE